MVSLTTDRLLLRPMVPGDLPEVYQIRSSEAVNQFLGRPAPKSEEEIRTFMKTIQAGIDTGKWFYWGICSSENDQLMGTICLWNLSPDQKTAEIGFELHPAQHRKGYMKESLKAVIDYAFGELKMDKLEGFTHSLNVASIDLMKSFGFSLERTFSEEENEMGEKVEMGVYGLASPDFGLG